ncbi:YbdD/YjiX family protein [Georgenia sp. AZ-5]|uniref:YbdD/YjiX family protein n=1 Tax=Georgenia sp. AZ-5 TaxID=3367526 RepID=UPI003754DE3E
MTTADLPGAAGRGAARPGAGAVGRVPRPATAALRRVPAALGRGLRAVRWYVTTVMGDHDYARYAAHRRRVHPDAPVVSEKEFWRRRWAEQDADPAARCC